MLKIFLIACFCFLIIGWSINANNTCTCSQMKIELDCDLNGCLWNQGTCQPFNCAGLSFQKCRETSNCFYNSSECVDFKSCSKVPFDSKEKCWDAKEGCYYYSGNTCSEFSCAKHTSANCPTAECFISGDKCTEYTSCSQFQKENCPQGFECMVDSETNSCRQIKCADLSSSQCLYVYMPAYDSIQPCTWQGDICIAVQNSSVFDSPSLCAYNTNGLYHWSTDSATDGICEACVSDPGPGPGPDPNPNYSIIIGSLVLLAFW